MKSSALSLGTSCEVFQNAELAERIYALGRWRETFVWVNELTLMLIQFCAVHTQCQVETARRLVLET